MTVNSSVSVYYKNIKTNILCHINHSFSWNSEYRQKNRLLQNTWNILVWKLKKLLSLSPPTSKGESGRWFYGKHCKKVHPWSPSNFNRSIVIPQYTWGTGSQTPPPNAKILAYRSQWALWNSCINKKAGPLHIQVSHSANTVFPIHYWLRKKWVQVDSCGSSPCWSRVNYIQKQPKIILISSSSPQPPP